MEIAKIIAEVYLGIAGISTILMIGKDREPITPGGAILSLLVLGGFCYLLSH